MNVSPVSTSAPVHAVHHPKRKPVAVSAPPVSVPKTTGPVAVNGKVDIRA